MCSIVRRSLFCKLISIFFLLGLIENTSLADDIVKQKKVVKHRVFIDQGHNPSSASFGVGAVGLDGLYEGDVTFSVGKKVKDILEKKGDYEVVLSRPNEETILGTDRTSGLKARVEEADNWNADVFLSIHCNSFEKEEANGTECYIYKSDEDPQNDMRYSKSGLLAALVLSSVTSKLGTLDRGVKTEDFYVIKNTRMPAALVELAFITNKSDAEKLKNRQERFAEAICKGITDYFRLFALKEKEKKENEARLKDEQKKQNVTKNETSEKKEGKKNMDKKSSKEDKNEKNHEGRKASEPQTAKCEDLGKKIDILQFNGTFDCSITLPSNLLAVA